MSSLKCCWCGEDVVVEKRFYVCVSCSIQFDESYKKKREQEELRIMKEFKHAEKELYGIPKHRVVS